MLIILSPDTAAESRWRVAHAQHAQCHQCEKAARAAATDARAFGSRGATYRITPDHSATVAREGTPA